MSQKLYQKNITDTLFKEIGEYSKMSLKLNPSDLTNINSEKYRKAKTSISNILMNLNEASKDFDELFDRYYDLLENKLPPLFYTHLKDRSDCNLDGKTIITDVSCHLHEQQIGCRLLGLQLKDIQTYESYFFVPIHGHTLAFNKLIWSNGRAHSVNCLSKSGDVHFDCSWEHMESTCIAALQKEGSSLENILNSCPLTKMPNPHNIFEFEDLYIVTGLYAKSARELLTGANDDPHETQVLSLKLDRAIKLSGSPPAWLRRKSLTNETAEVYLTENEFELLQSTLDYDAFQDVIEHVAFYPAVSATAVVILASGIIVLLVTYFRGKLAKTKLSTKYLPFIPWNRRPAAARPRPTKNIP